MNSDQTNPPGDASSFADDPQPPPASTVSPPPLPAAVRSSAPPPPTRRRKPFKWLLVAGVVVFCLIGGMIFLGVLAAVFGRNTVTTQNSYSKRIREEMIPGSGDGPAKIVVIDVKGVITSSSLDGASSDRIVEDLSAAADDDDVVAIVLDMNTPGGEVTASDEIHHAVQQVREDGTPVVVCMRAMGTSGGYYVAAAANHIVANRLTITGSIGVIMGAFNYSELLKEHGLKTEVYKSGNLKDILNGGRERMPEETALIQKLVDATFVEFATIVADGRERYPDLEAVLNSEFADGRILSGEEAYNLGLVDTLGYFDNALDIAREMSGAPTARVVRYRRSFGLFDLFLAIDGKAGKNLASLLPGEWQRIQPGRLYYLAPSVLN